MDNMQPALSGKRVAILATDGVERVELIEPRKALQASGARVEVVSPNETQIKSVNHDQPGEPIAVDIPLNSANAEEYDALVLPGGVMNPDKLRMNGEAMDFVRHFFTHDKPIAAICHGPWSLVEINAVRGRTLTSWPSLHADIVNAGGNWVDREVVVDGGLVTSRKPDDIPAFNRRMIEEFAGDSHRKPDLRAESEPESAAAML